MREENRNVAIAAGLAVFVIVLLQYWSVVVFPS